MIPTIDILKRAKEVSRFAPLSTEEKNNAILKMADSLIENKEEILSAIKKGIISEEIIDTAVKRILAFKYTYGII